MLVSSRSKTTSRRRERSKKRNVSDKGSESEGNSTIASSVTSNDLKTKRRHRKNTAETPKVFCIAFYCRLGYKLSYD